MNSDYIYFILISATFVHRISLYLERFPEVDRSVHNRKRSIRSGYAELKRHFVV